jgi:hypothetical protein
MRNQDELIAQAEAIIKSGEKVLSTEKKDGQSKTLVNEQQFHDFRISTLSYLSRVFGEASTYYQSFKTEVTHPTASRTKRGVGLLTAARRELHGDWLETTSGAISSDILKDILGLAGIQLDEGNHAAAAIITGAILEKQLRNICLARGVATQNETQGKAFPKKGPQLAGDAYKKKIIPRNEYKTVVSWLELSSLAAGEKDEPITADQVKNMLNGVLGLVATLKY